MNLRTKMAIMLIIPILALIFLAQYEIRRSMYSVSETDKSRKLIQFTSRFSSMVHELQKERGLSTGYLGSGDSTFTTKLLEQHKQSDVKISILKSFLDGFYISNFGDSYPAKLENVLSNLTLIKQTRQAILKKEITYIDALNFYTETLNGQFLDFIVDLVSLSSIRQSVEFNAYVYFFQSKELAGIERAVISNALARGQLSDNMYELFTRHINNQAVYEKIFSDLASEEQKRFLASTMTDPAFEEVAKIRSIILMKQRLTADLNSIIGYGGLIHHFKNYILRGDEKYINAFNIKYQDASKILNTHLMNEQTHNSLKKNIVVIKETLDNYKKMFDTANKMHMEGKNAEEIDIAVKIDDKFAIGAISQIISSGFGIDPVYWFDTQTKKINLLKQVEDKLSQDLMTRTEGLAAASSVKLYMTLLLTLLTLGITVFAAIYFSRSIFKQVGDEPRRIQEIAAKIAMGDLDIKTKGGSGILGSIEKVTKILRDTSEVVDRISDGDTSVKVEQHGDKDLLAISINKMVNTLNDAASQANVIASGDYTAVIKPKSAKDILGIAMQRMTEILRSTIEQNRKQLWISEGLSSINNIARGETDIHMMASSICKYLAKYLQSQILTFYSVDKDKLRLVGGYALFSHANMKDTISIGEGLVGQAALEKETIIITDVPEDYLLINSSIGAFYPRNIAVIPFVADNSIFGVIEIGSFNECSDEKLELLESLKEPIGIAMRSIYEQTTASKLLIETQEQSRELECQQEDLIASNQHLAKQARLLKESEQRLQAQQEELKVSNEELEDQTRNLMKSEERLQSQEEELRVSNEELEAKAIILKEQRDVLDMKNSESEIARNEIEQKAEELELANSYKSEFLASMSHELRTPLNSLLILAKLLEDNKSKNLTEKQVEFARTIHQSGNDLLTLINDILDLSKVEAGKLEVNWERIILVPWITHLENSFKHVAEQKDLAFSVTISDNVPEMINSDSTRVAQILKNLLSNAFKFTAKGEVSLTVQKPSNGLLTVNGNLTADSAVAFKISDTGIGLPEDKQKIIFEAFQQADSRTNRKYGGTGLGLSISKELARLLGGELHLKSEEGKGSTFTLLLPICHPEVEVIEVESKEETVLYSDDIPVEETVSTEQSKATKLEVSRIRDDRRELKTGDKSVLIVDDDPSFLEILSELAHEKGFKTLVAGDGHAGLHLADYYQPSAIILDIKMPELNGFDVMERLKANTKTRNIPVHFISGDDRTAEAIETGAIGFLLKPVSSEDIEQCFEKFERLLDDSIKSVLIVEDNNEQQKSIIALLDEQGIASTAIGTGDEAVALLKKNKFDCVILDLGLSGKMTGLELANTIKNDATVSRPSIIVYTGRELSSDDEYKLKQCSDSIIIKGVDSSDMLIDEVNLFLHKVEDELPEQHRKALKAMYSKDESLNGKKVLIVDDDMRNVFALSSAIQDQGMSVTVGKNGREGLEQLKANPDVDLVLMDIMMPEMDGYEAMSEIRLKDKFIDLPIIALTAKAMKGEKERCTEAGASDYLSKPVDTDRLLSLMRVWLHQK
ncbi:MAG: response regulator [Candidatus Scalindua sp.]|nr:response regulator [Candidatus Scalindua sp.]